MTVSCMERIRVKTMRRLPGYGIPAIFLLMAAMFSGCWTQEVFLQDLSVTQSVGTAPVHLTADSMAGTIRLSPRVALHNPTPALGRVDGHSRVNRSGVFQYDVRPDGSLTETPGVNSYPFEGKNLAWNVPHTVGLDLDVALTNRFALDGSLEFGLNTGGRVVNGSVGASLLFPGRNYSGRLEGGVRFQRHPYEAQYMVAVTPVFSGTTLVSIRNMSGVQTSVDPYVGLTINTDMHDRVVGWLMSLGYSGETLLSFDAPADRVFSAGSFAASMTVVSFTPAIVIRPARDVDLIAGVRIIWPGIFRDAKDPAAMISPMLQLGFTM